LSVNFYICNFLSRTAGLILARLGTNHPWGGGDSNCSNERECLCPRGDNSKRVEIHLECLKIFFLRISMPISIKCGTNHPWVKGILNCLNKGPNLLLRGNNHKNGKIGSGHLKIFSRTAEPEKLTYI
jgi:hypothetical protein